MKSARKPKSLRKSVRRPVPLSLTMRVERLEKAVLFKGPESLPAPKAGTRFINLGADGKPLTGDHVAVYDTKSGLVWTAEPLQNGKDLTHEEATKAAASLNLFGKKDWRLATIQELLSIVDYERCDPAVDTSHFKGPYGWTWSSTVAKAPAGYAWIGDLYYGYSVRARQGFRFRALAVRAGQQLGLSV